MWANSQLGQFPMRPFPDEANSQLRQCPIGTIPNCANSQCDQFRNGPDPKWDNPQCGQFPIEGNSQWGQFPMGPISNCTSSQLGSFPIKPIPSCATGIVNPVALHDHPQSLPETLSTHGLVAITSAWHAQSLGYLSAPQIPGAFEAETRISFHHLVELPGGYAIGNVK